MVITMLLQCIYVQFMYNVGAAQRHARNNNPKYHILYVKGPIYMQTVNYYEIIV